MAQAAQSNVSGGWLDQAWARLRSLVTVRPIGGDVPGDSPEAHVARAEARLDEGDLASAVNEVQALYGAAAESGVVLSLSAAQQGDLGLVISPFGTIAVQGSVGPWKLAADLTAGVDVVAWGRHGVTLLANPAKPADVCFTATFVADRFEITSALVVKYFGAGVARE